MGPAGSFTKYKSSAFFQTVNVFHVSVLLPVVIIVGEKSVLAVGVAEDLFQCVKIPNCDKVEVKESEPKEPRPAVMLVEMP